MHSVWRTWDRLPLLVPETKRRVYAHIQATCQESRCRTEALDVTGDQAHLVVVLAPTLAVAELAKHINGASSHLAAHEIAQDDFSEWARFAASINSDDLPTIVLYGSNQQHHRDRSLIRKLECPDD